MSLRPYKKSPTGALIWRLPLGLEVFWPGRGGRLQIGYVTTPEGPTSFIDHPTADGKYQSASEAQSAVDAFIAATGEA